MSAYSLRRDAIEIWKAGVAAVRPEKLIPRALSCTAGQLIVAGETFDLTSLNRIVVVGAGKAGAAMAAAVEDVLGPDLCREKLVGWVNVPENCVRPLRKIQFHAARPAGVNEPTEAGVIGTQKILNLVQGCGPDDLCLVLISGGGSALLPAPIEGISLAEKQAVTRQLMLGGATINELNTVRKHLSAVKGGKLAIAARNAKRVIGLIISDVVDDPLDVIASGPTVADSSTAKEALAILDRIYDSREKIPVSVRSVLEREIAQESQMSFPENVTNQIIGSNRVALEAAATEAKQRGYAIHSLGSENEGIADEEGRKLVQLAVQIRDHSQPLAPPVCLLSGGEPVVHFTPNVEERKGGRNQQLALAALVELKQHGCEDIVLVSGGTDGEDGPTNAAGALVDEQAIQEAERLELDPTWFRDMQDAYPFFAMTESLLITGPTNTNVMDLRVVVIADSADEKNA